MVDFVQADLDAVNQAIKLGERSVQYRDRSVSYRSVEELLRVRDLIKGELEGSSPSGVGRRTARRFRTRTGW